MAGYDAHRDELLLMSLRVAVLGEIETARTADPDLRAVQAANAAAAMGSGMDDMLYGAKGCTSAFAAVARALALLSFAPGGVTFGPLRWCAAHLHERWTEADGVLCPRCLAEEIAAKREPDAA